MKIAITRPWQAGRFAEKDNLRHRFHARLNHLNAMRLGLAVTVAYVHALAVGFGHQPGVGKTLVGDLAVDAFFVLSGFLITASYLRLQSVRRYLWHRFLRIMPGFWVCLALTAVVVAPALAWMQGRSAFSVFVAPENSAGDYVVANFALLMRQFDIAGLPTGVPEPGVLDGSLWTLFYEAICYLGIILLALLGGLRRRPALALAALCVLWALTAMNATGFQVVGQERMLRFAFLFLLGAVGWLYAERVPVHGVLAAGSLAILVPSLFVLPDYRALAAPAFAYLCLWVAVTRPPRRVLQHDLSYGVYVYHWPIQQLLVVAGFGAWGEVSFVAVSVALVLVAAAVSWRMIERPALGFKNAAWVERGAHRMRPLPAPGQPPGNAAASGGAGWAASLAPRRGRS